MSRDIAGGEHGPRRERYTEAWLLWDRAYIGPVPPVVSSCSVGFCVRVQLLFLASSLVVMTRSLISSSCLDALQKLGVFCLRQDLTISYRPTFLFCRVIVRLRCAWMNHFKAVLRLHVITVS